MGPTRPARTLPVTTARRIGCIVSAPDPARSSLILLLHNIRRRLLPVESPGWQHCARPTCRRVDSRPAPGQVRGPGPLPPRSHVLDDRAGNVPSRGSSSFTDGLHRPDQTAHHRPAERIGADVRGQSIPLAFPVEALQFSHRRGTVSPLAERCEIVQSDQCLRRLAYRVQIDRPRPGHDSGDIQRIDAVERCAESVLVVTAICREPSVEVGRDPVIARTRTSAGRKRAILQINRSCSSGTPTASKCAT